MIRDMIPLGMVVVAVLAATGCAQSHRVETSDESEKRLVFVENRARVPDEYLVTLIPEADESVIVEIYGKFGIRELSALGGETWLLVLAQDPGPAKMEQMIQNDERVRAVQPNLIYWVNRPRKGAQ